MNAPLDKNMQDVFAISKGQPMLPLSHSAPPAAPDDVFSFVRTPVQSDATALAPAPAKSEDVFIIGMNRPSVIPATAVPGVSPSSALLTISNAEYHSMRDIVSTSMLKALLRSPAHMKAMYRKERKELPSQRIGTGYHCATLEPDRFLNEYVVYDGYRRGDKWELFRIANKGKTIITKDEYDTILGMREATFAYTDYPLKKAIELGEAEQSIIWTDEETGVRCRIRPDLLLRDVAKLMLDLKSCGDCRPEEFKGQIFRMDYDLQAAMYIIGMHAFTGEWFPFYFVACEDEDPYGVWVYEVLASEADEIYMSGLKKLRRALELYKRCVENDHWPKYASPYTSSGCLHIPKYLLGN